MANNKLYKLEAFYRRLFNSIKEIPSSIYRKEKTLYDPSNRWTRSRVLLSSIAISELLTHLGRSQQS